MLFMRQATAKEFKTLEKEESVLSRYAACWTDICSVNGLKKFIQLSAGAPARKEASGTL